MCQNFIYEILKEVYKERSFIIRNINKEKLDRFETIHIIGKDPEYNDKGNEQTLFVFK